ncbi:CRISPR-associated endoribonuclease Cas6 [Thomasclavelia sp.]
MYNIKLDFNLENNMIPDNINIICASFMKQALQMDNESLYEMLYETKERMLRKYTFCVKMRSIKYQDRSIFLANNNISIEFTDFDFSELLVFYNAFLNYQYQGLSFSMNRNSMKLVKVSMKRLQNIIDDEVIIKMESPLVVRYSYNNIDNYLGIEDDNFEKILNMITKKMLYDLGYNDANIDISLIKGKKTVTNLFRHKATATLGYFKITGNANIIAVLLQTGIGSRRAAGLGKFKIVG